MHNIICVCELLYYICYCCYYDIVRYGSTRRVRDTEHLPYFNKRASRGGCWTQQAFLSFILTFFSCFPVSVFESVSIRMPTGHPHPSLLVPHSTLRTPHSPYITPQSNPRNLIIEIRGYSNLAPISIPNSSTLCLSASHGAS